MSDPVLVQRGVELQTRLNRLLRAIEPDDPWLAVELTMPQLKVLFRLNAHGPSRVGALAGALQVTLPTTTGILDRLVEQGLIRRDEDPDDRRLVISRLTPRGQELVDQLQAAGRHRLERVYGALSEPDLAQHVASLERLVQTAESLATHEAPENPAGSGRR